MILGISASGRPAKRDENGRLLCGVTEEMVKYILEKTGEPYEYMSLGGKTIKGCQACLKCAGTNTCVVKDDWAEIRDKMFEADAIVFGAPNYYGSINALGHAFLERTFSLRHRSQFKLAGKLNAIIAIGGGSPNPAEEYTRKIFRSNYMTEPVGVLKTTGLGQCYQCGYGENCASGAVVPRHGFLDEIKDYHLPHVEADAYRRADILANRLGEIIRANKKA
ncbi:MAG: flavodoxin family protein [Candidatus Bathyarchaeota archaeon]|nr:flavodoxin family protein [Candidatus Bathyarchaeota archaeon]